MRVGKCSECEYRVSHLHPSLGEVDLQRELLSRVNVRVVRLGEHALELFELRAGERGANAPLLSLLVQSPVVREQLVGNCRRTHELSQPRT